MQAKPIGQGMKKIKDRIIRTGMDALYYTGAAALLRPFCAGAGTIFMLHHVRPASPTTFQPNRHLEISPEFLRTVLAHVRSENIDIITLDEMARRLARGDTSRRFACFTFDDGYRDNRDFALPVMRAFDAPMTVYVASDFASGTGRLWWTALERIIAGAQSVDLDFGAAPQRLACDSSEDKQQAFATLHDHLRALPSDAALHEAMTRLCARHGLIYESIGRDLCMDWDELRAFAADPFVTIGAHTLSHCHLAKADETQATHEMAQSRDLIAAELNRPVQHFAYPYGDRAAASMRQFDIAKRLGFVSAVTTRPGMIFTENAAHMHALPRLSLNGNYQTERMLRVLTSGAATAMWNGFRRVNAA